MISKWRPIVGVPSQQFTRSEIARGDASFREDDLRISGQIRVKTMFLAKAARLRRALCRRKLCLPGERNSHTINGLAKLPLNSLIFSPS